MVVVLFQVFFELLGFPTFRLKLGEDIKLTSLNGFHRSVNLFLHKVVIDQVKRVFLFIKLLYEQELVGLELFGHVPLDSFAALFLRLEELHVLPDVSLGKTSPCTVGFSLVNFGEHGLF